MPPPFIKPLPDGVLLSIKVQPRASRNAVGREQGDELKLQVTAPPVGAAANEAVLKLLAKTLRIAKSHVQLVRGHRSRSKVVKIVGLNPEAVRTALQR